MDEGFRKYVRENPRENQQKAEQNFEKEKAKLDPEREKDLRATAKKMEGKSEEELMGEILRQAELGKQTGKLSRQDIDRFYENVYPMLSREQRRKLDSIIKKIK